YASPIPSYSCAYQPGNALYVRVVSDQGGTPIAGFDVTGKLMGLCPVVFECTGGCSSPFQTSAITTLGEWGLVTNASGYLTVLSPMLGGSAFWLTFKTAGHTYLAAYEICGGGVTMGQLSLPSGSISGREIPAANQSAVGSMIEQNGTQVLTGCNPASFTGNASIS
ncbi:MAG TPA: hypothetical protein VLX33_03270, partial [Nitrososphaerales archaeon]|nr:hypothetical protein [Nitrososphaerales archaeon]